MRYIKRLLGLPFFLMLNIVSMVFVLFKITYFWMKYGGEAITYARKDEPKMIADIYDELIKQKK